MVNTKVIRIWLSIVLGIFLSGCMEKPRIIEQKCSTCHSSSYVYREKRTMNEWSRLINGMKARGLRLTPDEERDVMQALSNYYSVK
jgi:hypothetical protein